MQQPTSSDTGLGVSERSLLLVSAVQVDFARASIPTAR